MVTKGVARMGGGGGTEVPVNLHLYAFEQTTFNIQVVKTAVNTLCLTKCDPL